MGKGKRGKGPKPELPQRPKPPEQPERKKEEPPLTRRGLFASIFGGAAEPLRKELATYKPLMGEKGITRREFLIRAGVGTAAVAVSPLLARELNRRLPFWLGFERSHLLHFGFTAHKEYGAKFFVDLIDEAKARGEPFDFVAMEAAELMESERRKKEREWNGFLDTCRKSGLSFEALVPKIKKMFVLEGDLQQEGNEYLFAKFAVEGIPIKIFEAHSPEEKEWLARHSSEQHRLSAAFKSIPGLKERMNVYEEFLSKTAEIFNFRNRVMARGLKNIVAEVPAKEDKPVRILVYIGSYHFNVLRLLDPSLIESFRHARGWGPVEKILFGKMRNPNYKPERIDLAKATVYACTVEVLTELKKAHAEGAEAIEKAVSDMTMAQFDDIDARLLRNKTASPTERVSIILDALGFSNRVEGDTIIFR